jgi:hypothetical protein
MKLFLPFAANVSIVRNGKTVTLEPMTQSKGSQGVFPGLNPANFNLEDFKAWLPKDAKENADKVLADFLCASFNEISTLQWREAVKGLDFEIDSSIEKDKRPTVQTDETTYKTLLANFLDYLNGELGGARVKERDAKYFRALFSELVKACNDEKDAAKKIELRKQAFEAKKTADNLQKIEDAKVEADFLSLGVDTTPAPTPEIPTK